MSRFEIAIIGTGPAGVSAAITAKVRNKNIVLFGSKKISDKVSKAHAIRNYPGLPEISGEDFSKAMLNHLDVMDIDITEEQVTNIYAMGDYFAIQTSKGMYEADSVILTSGVVVEKPLEGEEQFLGRGVSYCATCDGFLYKGKTVSVLGSSSDAVEETKYLSTLAEKVYYFPMKGAAEFEEENIEVVKARPSKINGKMKANSIVYGDNELETDGIFILRDAIAPNNLVPGLEVKDNHVVVNLNMETNLPGLFAAGDIAGRPYQYVKAAGQGNVAALSAVSYLFEKKEGNKNG